VSSGTAKTYATVVANGKVIGTIDAGALKLVRSEEALIEATERKLLGVDVYGLTESNLRSLHTSGAISSQLLLEHFGLSTDEKPEDP